MRKECISALVTFGNRIKNYFDWNYFLKMFNNICKHHLECCQYCKKAGSFEEKKAGSFMGKMLSVFDTFLQVVLI